MKILTFNWHEGYIHLLSKTGYQFDVVEVQKGGRYGWIHEFRPVPKNCTLVSLEEAKAKVKAGAYNRIICHNLQDLSHVADSPIPKVLLHHNKLPIETGIFDKAKQEEFLTKLKHTYSSIKNISLVFVSKAKKDTWGLDGEVILLTADPNDYGGYDGGIEKVIRIGNLIKERDFHLGYSIQERILKDLPSVVLGLNPNLPNAVLPKNWDEFKNFLRTHRVYLHTTSAVDDGYNCSMLEAMATGMPVVSIANPTSPIEDGVNGFISDDEDYLRERIIELLKDHYLAKSIGQKARETVIEKFPIERFIREWKRVLGDLTGFQCHSVDLKCRICGSPVELFYETFMSQKDTKDNENVIPAKAGIQKAKSLDSRLHGNDGLEVFSGESDRKFYRCPNCLLIFTEHILGKKDCERHYKAQWETVDEGFWRNEADAVLNIVHQYIIPHKILDFGAGSGGLTKELIKRGLDVVPFEPMLHGNFNAQNFNDKFDVVVAKEVIEHIESIYQVLEDIEKVLSKDGVIFFSTCLTDKFIYESNAVEQFQHWWYKDDLTHVNYFCRNAVKKLAQVLKYNVDFYGDNVFVLSRSGERQRANNIKERKRLKVLMSYTSNPATTAVYIEKAMRKSHDVITYGPVISDDTLKAWNLEAIKDRVKDHDIPYFTPDLKVVLKALSDGWPDGWTPDVFLWIESGIWYQIENIRNLPCPAACYLIDTHIHFDKHLEIAKDFDCVFIAQKEYIQMFKDAGIENVFWLPLACDPEIHTPLYPPLIRGELKGGKKLYDIGFVGSLTDPKRIKLLNKLISRFNVHYERCFLERMAEVFSQSKIIFNNSVNNDLNMRVFEAMASGSMLITDEAKGSGLTELFQDKRHLVIYRDEKELIDLADCYLRNDTERERIAEHGMREVLGKHTYEHRIVDMLNILKPFLLDERKKKDTLNKSDTIRIIGRAKVDFTSDSKKFYERYWKEGTIVSEATFQRYQAILKEFFTDEIKGKHILEIGVGGEGGIIYYLKDGNEVYGIDASLSAEKNCKRLGLDIQIVNVDKEGIPFSDGFFDVIFAFEVAEHFANPQFAFEEIRRVLKDDGILLLSTPNPLIHHWPRLFYPDLFEKKAFEEFLMINGFQIIKKSGSGVNIHQHILRSEDSRAWMWFWNCRKVSSDRSGVFMDYGKYFWRQKNEFGIRTRPIEAIDMFRISCQKNNNNLEARFYLTWALLYRYIYGETEEFLQNLVILFDIAGTAKYPFNMQAVCQILLIYLEAKILGVEVFRHDLFVDLVQRYFCFQDSKLYIENLNKMNNDFDMEAFLYLIYETNMSNIDTKGNENVIPAKAGIQRIRELDSRLHGNDGLEVFSYQNNSFCEREKTGSEKRISDNKHNQLPTMHSDDRESLDQACNDYFRQERSDLEGLIPSDAIKILDIGCGEGTLGKRLLKKGIKEVIGIEINPDACKNAGHNLSRVICGDIEEIDLPFSEGYFDCIICGDVLEHLKDPLSVLKKIKNYLSDAGAIIASIPNVRYHGVINMLAEGRWKYEDYGILDRTHLRFFTKKEIEKLFHDAGFEITGITDNIDPQYNNINPLSQNISFGRVTLNRLNPDELKDLFVIQYLIRAQKVRHALHAEPGNLEDQKTELEEYLNAHPADLNMLYKYAEICYKLGFKEKAIESLEKILIFEPAREDAIELREKIVDI